MVGVTVAAGAAAALSVGSAVFFAVDSIAPIAAFEKLVGLSVGSAFATRYLTLVSGDHPRLTAKTSAMSRAKFMKRMRWRCSADQAERGGARAGV